MLFNDGLFKSLSQLASSHQDNVFQNLIEADANLTALFKSGAPRSLAMRGLDVYDDKDEYLARGDPNIEIDSYVLDEAGSELGFFAFAILCCVFILLNQVDGKIFRLKIFLMNRDFSLVQNPGFVIFVNFMLNIMSWLSLLMPFLAMAVWASGLIIRAKDFKAKPIGGISVLLVGMTLFFFVFSIFKIKWNNYQFKVVNGVCILMAFLCFTAYQFAVIFMDESSNSYFGFSTVFLNANCCIMILTIFLNSAIKGGSVSDILMNKLPKSNKMPDREREDDFLEEVQEQRSNKSYFPCFEDVIDLFTIGGMEGDKDDLGSAFGGGLQSAFHSLPTPIRRTISFFLWCCATAILIVYAYVIYWYMDKSRLGFVTMIAVLMTDVFVYLIYNSGITQSYTVLCFACMLNRLMLYVFGGNYWIYGYMVLYLIYGVILSYIITKKRFPFEDAFNDLNIDKISQQNNHVDVSRAPEFLLIFITTIFVALFVILYVTEPRGVPLLRLYIDEWEYPYYIIGVFCLLLIAAFFSLLGTYRLFIRKKRRIEPKVFYFIKDRKYDMYWIFISTSFFLCAAVGLIAYWITDILSYFLVIIFVSIFVILYLNAFLHYNMNDYSILQDIKMFNEKIKKHNERLDLLKEKVTQFKKDLLEGKSTGVGEAALGLAQNIINNDKIQKKQVKEQKKIQEANQQLAMTKSNAFLSMGGPPTRLTLTKGGSAFNSNKQQNTSQIQKSPSNYNSKGSAISGAGGANQASVQLKVQPITLSKVQPVIQQTTMNNGSLTPGDRDDDENLINEEILRNNAKVRDDEMYEGGEDENDVSAQNLRLQNDDKELEGEDDDGDDSTDDELDFEAEGDENDQKKQKRRLKPISDWRDEGIHPITAFFTNKLRHNDYQIIWSLVIAHVALIIMAILVSVDQESVLGVNIAVPLVHYTMAAFSMAKILNTDAKMTIYHYFFFFSAYAIQYGWAIANLFISYSRDDIDPTLPGSAGAGTYMVVYLMVIPFITSSVSAAAKWIDDKGRLTPFLFIQLLLSVLQGIGMLVLAYVYMTYIQGIIVSVIVAALLYIISQVYIYVRNDYYMPNLWTAINLIIVIGIIISATVVSFFFEEYRTFTGISISCWVTAALFIVYALSEIGSDLSTMEKKPVFFSPWIFPVYIYNPKKNDVESHSFPTAALLIGLSIIILWSVLCSCWVYPHNVGVSIGIFFELLLIISCFHLIGVSAHQLKSCTQEIDKKIIRRAWLDAKLGYINNRSAINRDQLMTYEKIKYQRDVFRNYMRILEGRNELNLEEKDEGVVLMDDDIVKNDIADNIDENKVNLGSKPSCYSYLFELEKEQNRIYREELELIIQFQLLIVQQAENLQEQKKKYLFTFLNEKKAALFALGIVITIPDQGTMSIRYARVITQIQKLSPEKQTMFNNLRDHYIQEQRDIDEKRREAAMIEEQKEKERQEMLSQMSEEKKKLLASVTMDMPVDKMPDCEMKWDKIKLEAQQGTKFVDNQFKAGPDALGPNCLNRGVSQWVRASDKPQCVIFKDKINHLDVVQGALGDCYFLSAISVLGEKFVKKIILSTEEEWRLTGAICVQFFKEGEPEYIIIDDMFPAYPNSDWVFVKGGDQGDEIWPMILEKAYAKMYGTYNYIEAGKVQYALSDMTDGFPEQIDLKVDGKNTQKLWETLKTLRRTGCLMGAGSPEHAMGDRAINEMGIVQGHAYAVLDVIEVDGHKLMQLRNPHGSSGEEWKGDWSDTCEKWDQRMRNKVGYTESQRDGVFWMEVLDFVQQYSYLYICRILDTDDGWKEVRMEGRWQGASAEGLPSRKNPNARLDFNPQYAITVTKPCDGFVSLMQKDKVNMFKGKHSIFFMVSKTGGKRISKVDKTTLVAKSGNPINLNIITAECDFDKSVSYPYKFTIMLANAEHGEEGEGEFEFLVYATDPNMKVEPIPFPKDFPQNGKAKDIE